MSLIIFGFLYILGVLAFGYYELRTKDDSELGYLTWILAYCGVGGITLRIIEISEFPASEIAAISILMLAVVSYVMNFLDRDAKRRRRKSINATMNR